MSGACNRAACTDALRSRCSRQSAWLQPPHVGVPNDRNLEAANPVRPLPAPPVGFNGLDDLPSPPVPERVRLGRWLFYDTRLSADGTVSCATCHVPDRAFSNGRRVRTRYGRTLRASQNAIVHQRGARVRAEPVRLGRPRRLVGGAVPAAGREPRRNGKHGVPNGRHPESHRWLRAVLSAGVRRSCDHAGPRCVSACGLPADPHERQLGVGSLGTR